MTIQKNLLIISLNLANTNVFIDNNGLTLDISFNEDLPIGRLCDLSNSDSSGSLTVSYQFTDNNGENPRVEQDIFTISGWSLYLSDYPNFETSTNYVLYMTVFDVSNGTISEVHTLNITINNISLDSDEKILSDLYTLIQPPNIFAVNTTSSSIDISWTNIPNNNGYFIQYGISINNFTFDISTNNNYITLTDLLSTNTYYIRGKTIGQNNNDSNFSSVININPPNIYLINPESNIYINNNLSLDISCNEGLIGKIADLSYTEIVYYLFPNNSTTFEILNIIDQSLYFNTTVNYEIYKNTNGLLSTEIKVFDISNRLLFTKPLNVYINNLPSSILLIDPSSNVYVNNNVNSIDISFNEDIEINTVLGTFSKNDSSFNYYKFTDSSGNNETDTKDFLSITNDNLFISSLLNLDYELYQNGLYETFVKSFDFSGGLMIIKPINIWIKNIAPTDISLSKINLGRDITPGSYLAYIDGIDTITPSLDLSYNVISSKVEIINYNNRNVLKLKNSEDLTDISSLNIDITVYDNLTSFTKNIDFNLYSSLIELEIINFSKGIDNVVYLSTTIIDGSYTPISYQWYESSDGIIFNILEDETDISINLTSSLLNKYIRCNINYLDEFNTSQLTFVISDNIVAGKRDLIINGDIVLFETLSLNFINQNTPVSILSYQWFNSSNNTGPWTLVSTIPTYTISTLDINKYIKASVIYNDSINNNAIIDSITNETVKNLIYIDSSGYDYKIQDKKIEFNLIQPFIPARTKIYSIGFNLSKPYISPNLLLTENNLLTLKIYGASNLLINTVEQNYNASMTQQIFYPSNLFVFGTFTYKISLEASMVNTLWFSVSLTQNNPNITKILNRSTDLYPSVIISYVEKSYLE